VARLAGEQLADTLRLPVRQAEQAVEGLFRDGSQSGQSSECPGAPRSLPAPARRVSVRRS